MPWHVSKSGACPDSKPFAVIKDADGSVEGCHATEAAAQKQMAALYASEADRSMSNTERAIAVPTEFQFREVNGKRSFAGYAAVFDSPSEPMPFIESIAPGAFKRTLRRDKDNTFVIDHDDSKLLASRRAGTLKLAEDSTGLHVEVPELPKTSYANDLVELYERKEIRSMSFSFGVPRDGEEWSEDMSHRRLTEINLGHVTVLTGHQPAYPQTSAFIRSIARRLHADPEALAAAIRQETPARLVIGDDDSPAEPTPEVVLSTLARYQELLGPKAQDAFLAALQISARQ